MPLLSIVSLRVEVMASQEVCACSLSLCVYYCNGLRFVPVFASEMNHIMEAQRWLVALGLIPKIPVKLQLTMPLIVLCW